jgi:F-type H+-transporting ATPase subunit delta
MSSKAARRYASALLSFAIESKKVESVLADMESVKKTTDESRELVLFLKSPIIRDEKKSGVLAEIFKKKVSAETWSFLELLAEKSRLNILPAVADAFFKAYNKHAGIIEISVLTAKDPEKAQLDSIRTALEAKTGLKVKLTSSNSEELIGGIVIKMEDTVIDGSVKNKLQQLEHTFYQAVI